MEDASEAIVVVAAVACVKLSHGVWRETTAFLVNVSEPPHFSAFRFGDAGDGRVRSVRLGFGGQHGYQYDVDSKLMRLRNRFYND